MKRILAWGVLAAFVIVLIYMNVQIYGWQGFVIFFGACAAALLIAWAVYVLTGPR